MLIMISFMLITNIYLLNIFLAHTSMVYAKVPPTPAAFTCQHQLASNVQTLKEDFALEMERKNIILSNLYIEWAAHHRQDAPRASDGPHGLGRQASLAFSQEMPKVGRQAGMCYDAFEHMIAMTTESPSHTRLWFNLLDVNCSGSLSLEEFTKLSIIVRAPFAFRQEKIKKSKPRFPKVEWLYFHASLRRAREENPAEPVCDTHDFAECGVHAPSTFTRSTILWDLTYTGVQAMVNIAALIQPLLLRNFPTREDIRSRNCDGYPSSVWKIALPIFLFDISVTALAYSTELQPFAYIWPVVSLANGKKKFRMIWDVHLTHFLDIAFVAVLAAALCNVCDSEADNINFTVLLSPMRVFKCGMIFLRIPHTSRAFHAAVDCVRSILPVAATFFIVYYMFACIGCAAFAGCVTETGVGKPGDW